MGGDLEGGIGGRGAEPRAHAPARVHGGHAGPRQVRVRLHGHRLLGVVLRHVLVHLLHAQQRAVLALPDDKFRLVY